MFSRRSRALFILRHRDAISNANTNSFSSSFLFLTFLKQVRNFQEKTKEREKTKKNMVRNSVRINCHDQHKPPNGNQGGFNDLKITVGKILQMLIVITIFRFFLQNGVDAAPLKIKG